MVFAIWEWIYEREIRVHWPKSSTIHLHLSQKKEKKKKGFTYIISFCELNNGGPHHLLRLSVLSSHFLAHPVYLETFLIMLKEVVGFAPTISEHSGLRLHSSSPSTFRLSSISVFQYTWLSFLIIVSLEFSLVDAAHLYPNIIMPSQSGLDSSPSCTAMDPKLNYLPVIGILSHPGDGASGRLNNATNASYIAASYVKFVESAGARVIPLIYNEPIEVIFKVLKNGYGLRDLCSSVILWISRDDRAKVLTKLFQKLNLVNGVLFTGGWAKQGLYYSVAEQIFKVIPSSKIIILFTKAFFLNKLSPVKTYSVFRINISLLFKIAS